MSIDGAEEGAAPRPPSDVVRRWIAGGREPQKAMTWPRARWVEAFPQHAPWLKSLPDLLDREAVRTACVDATVDTDAAVKGFLAVMAWGYGKRGYGVYRTERMLRLDDAPTRLLLAASRLRKRGALDGYVALSRRQECRLPGLGPAFGTKYLYFCSLAESNDGALILDRLVADFLNDNMDARLNPVPWSKNTYQRYLTQMRAWSGQLHVSPEQLEECLFNEESRRRNNQWSMTPRRAT